MTIISERLPSQEKRIQMQKPTPENLAFSVNFIFKLNDWCSQNPHAQLSSNMYISLRLFRLERLQCTPNDARVNGFPRRSEHRSSCVMFVTVVGIAQLPCLPTIVTLFQVITKACENVNEVVHQLNLYCQQMSLTQQTN